MDMQELRNAALEIYNELERAGVRPQVSDQGVGLPHVMWLAVQIGKKIDDVNKGNRYLGNIQASLIYLRFWTHAHMMDRAFAWSRGDFKFVARGPATRVVRNPPPVDISGRNYPRQRPKAGV